MAINTEFKMLWDTKVKQTAINCIKDAEKEAERLITLDGEERETAKKEFKLRFVDINGLEYITNMISAIEHDLADDRWTLNSINLIPAVKATLSKDNISYWTNVWKNDLTSETAQNFLKLAEEMEELLRVM